MWSPRATDETVRKVWGSYMLPRKCRWFMTFPVPDLPGVVECRDCGMYMREDGSPLTPQVVRFMRIHRTKEKGNDQHP